MITYKDNLRIVERCMEQFDEDMVLLDEDDIPYHFINYRDIIGERKAKEIVFYHTPELFPNGEICEIYKQVTFWVYNTYVMIKIDKYNYGKWESSWKMV